MNLSLFFDPVCESLVNTVSDFNTFQNAFYIDTGGSVTWTKCDIALIGLNDYRGNGNSPETTVIAPDEIRKQLYKLTKSQVSYKLCDLGNLRQGDNIIDTEERLREVCEILLQFNVIPLIIGGSHNYCVGQYHAYEKLEKLATVLNIDASVDLNAESLQTTNISFLNKILLHEPNYLFNYIQLAYQSYVTDPELLNVFEKLSFEHYRLGVLRDNFEDIEPVVRQANMVAFDLGAIKIQDAPAQLHNRPFGLTGEEACRLAWYAGLSEKVNSFGIYEYYPQEDHKSQTANLIATMIWYFIEGFYHRIELEGFESEAFIKYNTAVNGADLLVFYKHRFTEKWWLQVPKPNKDASESEEYVVIPCSYSDYIAASNGELPDRWIHTQARLL